MSFWKITLGVTAVSIVGGAVFLATRKASAKKAASKAFKINADCSLVELISEDDARQAILDAGLASFQGTDEPAIDLLNRALKVMFPQCKSYDDMVFRVHRDGLTYDIPIGLVRLPLLGKTVGDLKKIAESGKLDFVGSNPTTGPADVSFLIDPIFGGAS